MLATGEKELVVAGGTGDNETVAQTMIYSFLESQWRVSLSINPDVRPIEEYSHLTRK